MNNGAPSVTGGERWSGRLDSNGACDSPCNCGRNIFLPSMELFARLLDDFGPA